jgi:hypothetical protein
MSTSPQTSGPQTSGLQTLQPIVIVHTAIITPRKIKQLTNLFPMFRDEKI